VSSLPRDPVRAAESAETPARTLPRWRVFPPLAIGAVMATLDLSVVNIALPTLARSFGVPLTTVEWVVLAYALALTGLLLPFGRLADAIGRRRMYASGLVVFTLASLACAAAGSAAWLVAARAVQGVGAAMMSANSAALLIAAFPAAERGKALGAFGALVGVGLAIGPAFGGLVVGHASWRWLFLVNLPLGLIAWRLLRARVAADAPRAEAAPLPRASAAFGCAALVSLCFALSRGPADGWSAPPVTAALAIAAAAAALLVIAERRATAPLLPVRWLRGALGRAALLSLLGQSVSIAVGFHLPLHLEEGFGWDAARAGRWLALVPVVALFTAPFSGRLADRVGTRLPAAAGLALSAAGCLLLATLGLEPQPWRLTLGLSLVGFGMGLFAVPNSSALLGAVPATHLGMAAGLQATLRNLGVTAGVALAAAFVASRYATQAGRILEIAGPGIDRTAFAQSSAELFRLLALVAVVAAALALWQPPEANSAAKD
jgi:EmrB/QacA subfamily drug resistance transporter